MRVVHITPSTNGYEIVTLIANRVSRKNHLALIEKDGVESMTGGIILNDNGYVRGVLDKIPKKEQYDYVKNFREVPYVKLYSDE